LSAAALAGARAEASAWGLVLFAAGGPVYWLMRGKAVGRV